MKVAITGGNGHIGNAIIEELLARNYEVKALIHSNSNFLKTKPIELITGSLHDPEALRELLKGCDFLIHAAAVISINGDPNGLVRKVNVDGLKNLLTIAQEFPLQRIIHLSSVHAYDQTPQTETLTEERRFVADTSYAYDKSKRDGQLICQDFVKQGSPIIVVNPTAVLGPPNYALCKQNSAFIAMSKRKIPFVFRGGYNWVDVRDVANSIVNALTLGTIGSSYILGGSYYTLKELSEKIATVTQKRIPCYEIPVGIVRFFLPLIGLYYKVAKQDPSVTTESIEIVHSGNKAICSDLAQRELQHRARPIEETLKDLLSWHKNNLK